MNRADFLTAAAIAALGMSCIQTTSAQSPSVAPMEAPRPASSYSDTELKSFAVAALDVQRIRGIYLPQFEAAATPEEQEQIQTAARTEMVQAIEKRGMTVDKYTEIARQAQARPEIAEQIEHHIQEGLNSM